MTSSQPTYIYRRALQRAREILGSEQRLARYLRVAPSTLDPWLAGSDIPPLPVLLRCVEVILDDERASVTQLYFAKRPRGEPE
ncbi:MAG: hypothetical protein EPO20_17515 [Betaproteobacteria bacterium]|nr:MAG: hypothetical protein EPO20_17515 [Betaproteobacteria bacterium]